MIIISYNIVQLFLLLFAWPLLLALVLTKEKYRKRIPSRLGWQLARAIPCSGKDASAHKTFWIHALSVGEVTSAVPLVLKLRESWPNCRIVVTVTTTTGEAIAHRHLGQTADAILPSPIDLLPVVLKYIQHIQPDIYIQVETDFWPNLLTALKRNNTPCLLVNGRISQKSLSSYKKLPFFFGPMFRSFDFLAMQTMADAENMAYFGVADKQLLTLGNLKYDIQPIEKRTDISSLLPVERPLLVAGSTHAGEEEIILASFRQLLEQHPALYLVLVPRTPGRAEEIKKLAKGFGFNSVLRSSAPTTHADLLIVDTIGELMDFYRHAYIAFVGGSLVAQGGHNPIEPAAMGVPVIYGPHMEDFQEIADELIASGGAHQVSGQNQLISITADYLVNPEKRDAAGSAAQKFIDRQRGVLDRHIDLIRSLL